MPAHEQISSRFILGLKQVAAQRGLDLDALALTAGLDPGELARALEGGAALELKAQAALAQAAGLEYDELLSLGRRLQEGQEGGPAGPRDEGLAAHLARMMQVAGSFRVADNVDEVYGRITESLCRHLPFRRAMLFLLEQGRFSLRSLTWSGEGEPALRRALEDSPPLLDPVSMEYETFALGRALPVKVEQSDFFPPPAAAILGAGSEVALAPLFTDREFIGVVAADYAGNGHSHLSEGDITVLETFATLTGALLHNVALYSELDHKNRELEIRVRELTVVGEMTRILNRSLGPADMARQMLALLTQTVQADLGFLFLYDDKDQELKLFAGHNLPGPLMRSWALLPGVEPEVLRDLAAGGSGREPASLLPGLEGPALLRPLQTRHRSIGLWGLARRSQAPPFSAVEEQVLATADEQVTVALTSLRLRLMATTDQLTGLYTRAHFFEALEQELKVARYLGHPLSLVLLDADRFKAINDRYGHLGGDEALAALGRVLRAATRHTDICARIGGEEFTVLLTRCDQARAGSVAEKLRLAVAGQKIKHQGQEIKLSVSLGVASQEVGERLQREQILDQADQALYRAKRGGRNRVCLYAPDADRSTWGSVAE